MDLEKQWIITIVLQFGQVSTDREEVDDKQAGNRTDVTEDTCYLRVKNGDQKRDHGGKEGHNVEGTWSYKDSIGVILLLLNT